MQLNKIPFFEELKDVQNILIAGAGGGYDVYSGLPLYFALKRMGKKVSLANLSFTYLEATNAECVYPNCYKVNADSQDRSGMSYFPERYLCEYLHSLGDSTPVYSFLKTGVQPLKDAYNFLIEELDLEAIVLVDGGTDSLMFGDEVSLGTPLEDIASMGAVYESEIEQSFLLCLGFGIDHYHGVSHYRFLENVSKVIQNNGYLGSLHVLPQMEEAQRLVEAVNYANEKMAFHPSIVANSIVSSLEGEYGNYHRTSRTRNSELWINPLMTIYWCFHLQNIIEMNLYYDRVRDTEMMPQINARIAGYRSELSEYRKHKQLPI